MAIDATVIGKKGSTTAIVTDISSISPQPLYATHRSNRAGSGSVGVIGAAAPLQKSVDSPGLLGDFSSSPF
jgi:hypothetical protein